MSTRSLLCIAVVTLAALMSPQVEAMLVTGSFSGIAHGEDHNGTETGTAFAEPVTGVFSFQTTIPEPEDCCPPTVGPGSLQYQGNLFDLSVHFRGLDTGSTVINDDWLDGATLLEEGGQQSFTLGGGGPYWYWSMSFVAPGGGLFQNFDPETFDPRQVDIGASYAAFSDDIRSYGATVSFDTLVFDGYPTSVPEPATLGLFGAGLLLLAGRKRKTG